MHLFQRTEVWIILLLASAAGAFVLFTSAPSGPDRPPAVANAGPATQEPARITRRTLERDHGNARLDLDVRVTNSHESAKQLVPPFAVLKSAAGREIPAFFLPMEPPPTLKPETTADVHLRFWLDAVDLQNTLTLTVDGQEIQVKGAKPVDLSGFENAKPAPLEP